MSKIYMVHLFEPIGGKSDFNFGSLAAIYTRLTVEQVGCAVENLWNYGIDPEKPFTNAKCTISIDELIRKPTNRGKHH